MKLNSYKTIKFPTENELKEKKSVFIAKAFNISNEKQAAEILSSVRKEYSDAAHHCYAYQLKNGKSKTSDDGEPHGTAGIKILNAIKHFQIQDCLVVVVRYFGGIKLGVGPLGKAYYSAALNVLSKAEIILKQPCYRVEISINFTYWDKLLNYLHSNNLNIISTSYDESVKLVCLIPVDIFVKASDKILELSDGRAQIEKPDEIIFN